MDQDYKHVFQFSGMRDANQKRQLISGIDSLGAKYIGGSVFQKNATHFIVSRPSNSEKFLAACAAGRWVLKPEYVLDSVKNGSWLPEEPYELTTASGATTAFYPSRKWRQEVALGSLSGAFQGWKVVLMIRDHTRRSYIKRILKAGMAKVYRSPPPSNVHITHVLSLPFTKSSTDYHATCRHIKYINTHLFGEENATLIWNMEDDEPVDATKTSDVSVDLADLETELKEYVVKGEERIRLSFPELWSYIACSQEVNRDLGYVGSMIECLLFTEALDTIRSELFPGLLPPVSYVVSLIGHAQQGQATPCFLRDLQQFLHSLLRSSPPWLTRDRRYFMDVLQCPQCKGGIWPFIQTAVRYCLSSQETCHPIPALPELLTFHRDLVAFALKIFQGELHSATSSTPVTFQEAPVSQWSYSLLKKTFWSVWDSSTLASKTVQQLIQLLVEASVWEKGATEDPTENEVRHSLHLVEDLLDMLCVVVEFWCTKHSKLNPSLVEKGLGDLAEHVAHISRDMSPVVLVDVVVRIRSSRLKLVTADAIFRNICCGNGITMGTEPITLKKIVSCYVPALNSLCAGPQRDYRQELQPGAQSSSRCCTGQDRTESGVETILGKENDLRGLNRVNAAGETLLHRACKTNQVDTVLQILALPGTDINVKDHAGWTPLHEACNHGSRECVEVLLRHRPAPHLDTVVGGVSPLYDALANGHLDIAKMLLENAGSVLLQRTAREGSPALDLVTSQAQRDELLHSARVGDAALEAARSEVRDMPFLEACSLLLSLLILSYQRERGLIGRAQLDDKARHLCSKMVQALETQPFQTLTSSWADQRAVKLVEDVEAVVGLGRYLEQVSQTVRECEGENTRFLMDILEGLKAQGLALKSNALSSNP